MRISINREMCELNGVCVGMAPDVFEFDEVDQLRILADGLIPNARRRELLEVIGNCPRGALSVIDE